MIVVFAICLVITMVFVACNDPKVPDETTDANSTEVITTDTEAPTTEVEITEVETEVPTTEEVTETQAVTTEKVTTEKVTTEEVTTEEVTTEVATTEEVTTEAVTTPPAPPAGGGGGGFVPPPPSGGGGGAVIPPVPTDPCANGHDEESHEAKAPTCTEVGWDAYVTCKRTTCTYTTKVEKEALGHDKENHEAKAPTCTEVGYDAYESCKREGCDYSTKVEKKATGHTYVIDGKKAQCSVCEANCAHEFAEGATKCKHCEIEKAVVEACEHSFADATCTQAKKCTLCGIEEGAALGHDLVEKEAAVAATCTEDGKTALMDCTRCDYTEGGKTVTKLGHDEESHEAKAPTCTEGGYDAYVTCKRCDYTTKVDKEALGHDMKETSAKVEAKCETDGKEAVKTCANGCGKTEGGEKIPAIGHDYEGVITTEPKCTEKGEKTFTCKNDATHTYKEEVDALGHDKENHEAKAPTCTEVGYDAYESCKREGCGYTTKVEKAALGHDKENHEGKAPTCTEAGYDAYETCEREGCDYTTKVEKEALGHDEETHEANAPTCTEVGYDAYETCKRDGCDYTTKVEKPSTGHNIGGEWQKNKDGHWHVCQNEGCTETDEKVAHISSGAATETADEKCTVCSFVIAPALGHKHNHNTPKYDETKHWNECSCGDKKDVTAHTPATDDNNCETEVKCTVCGYVTTEAKVHNTKSIVAKAPTCISIGYNAYNKCEREGCTYTQGYKELPALRWPIGTTAPINPNTDHTALTHLGQDVYTTGKNYTSTSSMTIDGTISDGEGWVCVTPDGVDVTIASTLLSTVKSSTAVSKTTAPDETRKNVMDGWEAKYYVAQDDDYVYIALKQTNDKISYKIYNDQSKVEESYNAHGVTFNYLKLGFNPDNYAQQITLFSNGQFNVGSKVTETTIDGVKYTADPAAYITYPMVVKGLGDNSSFENITGYTGIVQNPLTDSKLGRADVANNRIQRTYEIKLSKEGIKAQYDAVFGEGTSDSIDFSTMFVGGSYSDRAWSSTLRKEIYSFTWVTGTIQNTDNTHNSFIPDVVVFGEEKEVGCDFTAHSTNDKYFVSEADDGTKFYYHSCKDCGAAGARIFKTSADGKVIYDSKNIDDKHAKVEATCEDNGEYVYSCSCGADHPDGKTFVIEALGHDYEIVTSTTPTYTKKGTKTYVCKNDSSHSYTEEYGMTTYYAKDVSDNTPTLDGKIDANEYGEVYTLKSPGAVNKASALTASWVTKDDKTAEFEGERTDVSFAYDDENIYIAIYELGPKYIENDGDTFENNNVPCRYNHYFQLGFDLGDATRLFSFGGAWTNTSTEWLNLSYYKNGSRGTAPVSTSALIRDSIIRTNEVSTGKCMAYGDLIATCGTKNITTGQWEVVIEFKLNKADIIKVLNECYGTNYTELSNAMWIGLATTSFRYKGSETGFDSKEFRVLGNNDVSDVKDMLSAYGYDENTPYNWIGDVVVFGEEGCEIVIADKDPCKNGHDIVNHAAKAPTTESVGWNEYKTCKRCAYTTYEELSRLEGGKQIFKAGYSRVKITPEGISKDNPFGKFTSVRDDIYATCVAIYDGDQILMLVSVDIGSMSETNCDNIRSSITFETGVPYENIYISATHTHSTESFSKHPRWALDSYKKIAKTAAEAISDLKDTEMYMNTGRTPGMAFVRRYTIDGETYFGYSSKLFSENYYREDSPIKCASETDDSLQTLRFVREGEKDIVLLNWQGHLASCVDTYPTSISADIAHYLREDIEAGDNDSLVAFFAGASGNLNIIAPTINDAKYNDGPDSVRGNGNNHYAYVAKALAEVALDTIKLEDMTPIEGGNIQITKKVHTALTRTDTPEEIAAAKKRLAEDKYPNTSAGQIDKKCDNYMIKRNEIASKDIRIAAIAIGDLAFIAVPYEMFDNNGLQVKKASPFRMTFVLTNADGDWAYMPSTEAWTKYRGYETEATYFENGEAEKVVAEYIKMLEDFGYVAHKHTWTSPENPDVANLKSAANCDAPAVYYQVCSECGKNAKIAGVEFADETYVYGTARQHNIVTVAPKAPTCVAIGWSAATTCSYADCSYNEIAPTRWFKGMTQTEIDKGDHTSLTTYGQKIYATGNSNYFAQNGEMRVDAAISGYSYEPYVLVTPDFVSKVGVNRDYHYKRLGSGYFTEATEVSEYSTNMKYYVAQDEDNVYLLIEDYAPYVERDGKPGLTSMYETTSRNNRYNVRIGFDTENYDRALFLRMTGEVDGLKIVSADEQVDIFGAEGVGSVIESAFERYESYDGSATGKKSNVSWYNQSDAYLRLWVARFEIKINKSLVSEAYALLGDGKATEFDFNTMLVSVAARSYRYDENNNTPSIYTNYGAFPGREAGLPDLYVPDVIVFGEEKNESLTTAHGCDLTAHRTDARCLVSDDGNGNAIFYHSCKNTTEDGKKCSVVSAKTFATTYTTDGSGEKIYTVVYDKSSGAPNAKYAVEGETVSCAEDVTYYMHCPCGDESVVDKSKTFTLEASEHNWVDYDNNYMTPRYCTTCKTTDSDVYISEAPKNVKNILMIGNSFCYYYVEELYGIAKADGVELNIVNLYESGASVEEHYNRLFGTDTKEYELWVTNNSGRKKISSITTIKGALDYAKANLGGDWDVITLQQHFHPGRALNYNTGMKDTSSYAKSLFDYIKKEHPSSLLYWHETWAYQVGYAVEEYYVGTPKVDTPIPDIAAQSRSYANIKLISEIVAKENGVPIIPCGDAWQIARADSRVGDNMCARKGTNGDLGDYYHDGDIGGGQYLNACVWFEVLTGKSCVGNTWRPDYALSEDMISGLQAAAHEAVATVYGPGYAK